MPQARGIRRYTLSLMQAMARRRGGHDYRAALVGDVTQLSAMADAALRPLFPESGVYRCFGIPETAGLPPDVSETASEALIMSGLRRYTPDAIHFTNLFGVDRGTLVVPPVDPAHCPEVICATLYDLIPLVMGDLYLSDPKEDRRYRACLERLRNCDLVLSISESSRRDAIRLVGIEEQRIVTIGADASPEFRPPIMGPRSRSRMLDAERRLGIDRSFILYCSGMEIRKNVDRLIQAYSMMPSAIRDTRQLVICCAIRDDDLARLSGLAWSFGLRGGEVVFTGYVPDAELAYLYSHCELFVFPSLYEGFGLPVLEAMRCGAPVIASDTSSMPEVLARSDALFDPRKPEQIARLMEKVICDPQFRQNLSAHSLRRAKDFSWDACGDLAWQAIAEAVARKRSLRSLRGAASNHKRRRIAYVSPLPPAVSGIADYSADLIPALAAKVDLVVASDQRDVAQHIAKACAVIHIDELIGRRDEFDAIVYSFGNSAFHEAMWDIVPKAPGIAILHDVFLSGLVNLLEHSGDRRDYLCRTLFQDRGLNAVRRAADPSLRLESILQQPMCSHVLRHATGVVVHSQFAADLLANAYPWLGVRATVIPQVHETGPCAGRGKDLRSATNREHLKERLGLPGAFIIASFGHISRTKRIEDVVRSFAIARTPNDRLALVGGFVDEALTKTINRTIEELGLGASVIMTGYTEPERYQAWLQVADIGIQLREHSRGETSRSVLDCLGAGLPLIVNDYASLSELPDDIVAKVPQVPQPTEVASAMVRLRDDPNLRRQLGCSGRAFVHERHAPAVGAEKLIAAVDRAIEQPADLAGRREVREIAAIVGPYVKETEDDRLHPIAKPIALGRHATLPSRLFADVSYLLQTGYFSGIQRVTQNIVTRLMNLRGRPYTTLPTAFTPDSTLRWATEMEDEKVTGIWGLADGVARMLEPGPGDVLLLADSNWAAIDSYAPAVEKFKQQGTSVFSVVYDLLPIQFPDFFDDTICPIHRHWFETSARISDGLIAISRSVAEETSRLLDDSGFDRQGDILRIGWFYPGSDFAPHSPEIETRPAVSQLCQPGAEPYVLMVGNIEPRKNHQLAINAVERLTACGNRIRLVVAGKPGWNVDALTAFLYGRVSGDGPIVFVEAPSDPELDLLYRHAIALLMPSEAEGFGLPVVEAAQRQVPSVVNDTAVFREIGGEGTLYVDPHDVSAFADAIATLSREDSGTRHRRASTVLRQSWENSAAQLLDVIYGGNWYKEVR